MATPRSHLGVAFMLGVVAVVGIGLIVVRAQTTEEGASDSAIIQAHTQTRSFADPILQLCDQGGDVAARLSAKGLCGAAEIVRSEPVGDVGAAPMTPDQVQKMIRSELSHQRPAPVAPPSPVPEVRPPPALLPNLVPNLAPGPPALNFPRPVDRARPPALQSQSPPRPAAPRTYGPRTPRTQPPWNTGGAAPRPRYTPPGQPGGYPRPQQPYRPPYQQQPYRPPYQQQQPYAPPYQQQGPPRQPYQPPYQQQPYAPPYQQPSPYPQPPAYQPSPPYQQPAPAPYQQPAPAPQQQYAPPYRQQPPPRPQGLLSNLVGSLF